MAGDATTPTAAEAAAATAAAEAAAAAETAAATAAAETAAAAEAAAAAAAASGDDDAGAWDHERGMATIKKLREEVKAKSKDGARVAELETKIAELERAKMTDAERVQAERDEAVQRNETLERERRDDALKLAVYDLRDEMGIADTDLAIAALDVSQVEYDQAGKPSNLEELLNALLERKPLLKTEPGTRRAPRSDGGSGTRTGPGPALTAEELEIANAHGISAERYAAMRDGDVSNVDEFIAMRKKETQQPGA